MMHGIDSKYYSRKCPQHGYELSAQVKIFYNGLNYLTRALVDAVCGGSITMKTTRETNLMFEDWQRTLPTSF